MKPLIGRSLALAVLCSAIGLGVSAQQQERTSVPEKYKWDLSQIYPGDQAWRAAKDKLVSAVPAVRAFQGKLGSSAKQLADVLELGSRLSKDFSRIYVY